MTHLDPTPQPEPPRTGLQLASDWAAGALVITILLAVGLARRVVRRRK